MRTGNNRIRGIKVVKSFLTIIKEVKRLLDRKVAFLVNVVLKQWRSISTIELRV